MLKLTNVSVENSLNSMKIVYLVLTIVGTIVPWFWLLQDPTVLLDPSLFLQAAVTNTIATALANDLIISAIAFFYYVWIELKRLNVSQVWLILYVGLTFSVGLSCSLPFFLYRREQILERN